MRRGDPHGASLLSPRKTRAVFDRYNIINHDRLAAAIAIRFTAQLRHSLRVLQPPRTL
jgi:hypothetical protein